MIASTLPPGNGRRFGLGITVKVDTGQSPDYAVMESRLDPGWTGPPPHVHAAYDESFHVVSGQVRFAVGDETFDGTAGSFVHVPRGAAHGFSNPWPEPATVLLVTTPGALRLVEEIYELMGDDGSFDVEAMLALYARHQSEILAPDGAR